MRRGRKRGTTSRRGEGAASIVCSLFRLLLCHRFLLSPPHPLRSSALILIAFSFPTGLHPGNVICVSFFNFPRCEQSVQPTYSDSPSETPPVIAFAASFRDMFRSSLPLFLFRSRVGETSDRFPFVDQKNVAPLAAMSPHNSGLLPSRSDNTSLMFHAVSRGVAIRGGDGTNLYN